LHARFNILNFVSTLDIKIKKVEQSYLPNIDFSKIQFGKVYSDHMLMADYVDGQWTNTSIVPYQKLKLSPGNFTLHYGQSVFEGLKAYRGDNGDVLVFRPLDNFIRINKSAKRMCMPEIPKEIFMDGLCELLKLDRKWVPDLDSASLYIRPFMFGTDEYIGIKPSDTYKFVIFTCPVGSYYKEALKVKIEQEYVRAAKGGTGFAKAAGNYAASLLPAHKAMREGYQQLIWTDSITHERIEESGTMNLMFIINDTIVTPKTGDTILKGITRDSILTIARNWGVKVEERDITVSEVIESIKNGKMTEAFGTGTAAVIAHIKAIGYNGEDYNLPTIPADSLSNKLLHYLHALYRGRTEDKFNWLLHI
jgi:branched-chain amino acid aminotransferase